MDELEKIEEFDEKEIDIIIEKIDESHNNILNNIINYFHFLLSKGQTFFTFNNGSIHNL